MTGLPSESPAFSSANFLLLIHDAFHALAEFFQRFAFLDEFKYRLDERLRYVRFVHVLTSFCKNIAPYSLISAHSIEHVELFCNACID